MICREHSGGGVPPGSPGSCRRGCGHPQKLLLWGPLVPRPLPRALRRKGPSLLTVLCLAPSSTWQAAGDTDEQVTGLTDASGRGKGPFQGESWARALLGGGLDERSRLCSSRALGGSGPVAGGGRCAGVAVEQGWNGLGDEVAGAQGGQRASGMFPGLCVCPRGVSGEGGAWWVLVSAARVVAGGPCWERVALGVGLKYRGLLVVSSQYRSASSRKPFVWGAGKPRAAGSSPPLTLSSSAAEDKLLLCASVSSSAKWE